MNYKNTIGLKPSKEISNEKSRLYRHSYSHGLDSHQVEYFFDDGFIKAMYLDNSNVRQLREETWEKIDKNTIRIRTMTSIKNGVREGEQISVIWD